MSVRRRLLRWTGRIFGAILVFFAFVVVKTLTMSSLQPVVDPAEPLSLDARAAAERLAGAVRIPTVSFEDKTKTDYDALRRLHAYLKKHFPRVHGKLERTPINEFSAIYTWRGSDASLPPILLTNHLDVVPADGEGWEHPPFSGDIADGFVWGRGTMDDKVGVLGILEAAEYLLGVGFRPERTVCFAFGQDEEIDGIVGAKAITEHFKRQGMTFDFILDEGLMVIQGILPGLEPPAAVIGLAEKGYVNVKLTVKTEGGHSSMPPPQTAVGILSAAIAKLEAHPMPARLSGPVEHMFAYAAPEMPFSMKLVMGNLWLFGPVVKWVLAASPETNATIRTTAAPTMLAASEKANVLAREATAIVNFRLLPGDTIKAVLTHVRDVVDDDRVAVDLGPGEPSEASKVSRVDSEGFRHIAESVKAVFSDAVVAPTLAIPATDARHYSGVSENVYRFLPIRVAAEDLARFHGLNERISVEAYGQVIAFYAELIRRAAGGKALDR